MPKKRLVVVIGGAVAGSEAVFQLREKGIEVICIEQNPLPYGKIEDGLPRWHVEQRKKEEEKINERIDHKLVHYVPMTKIGQDLSFEEIRNKWKPSAILLANGAWKDRPLPVEGADTFVGKGFLYQNPLVYWFNHYTEADYDGLRYDIPDGVIVIGGGLASMDVMKICQFEIVQKALSKKKIQMDMLTLEKEGIPKALERHSLTWNDLGVNGATLFYRRRTEDMPLAEPAPEANEEQRSKVGVLRKKILNNYMTKYQFAFHDQHLPISLITDGGRLVGLKFVKTEVIDGKAKPVKGSEFEVRAPLVISSIGSIPEPIPGLNWTGDRYDVPDLDSGQVRSMPGVYALGNAVTGKGNIRVSLMHSRDVTSKTLDTWLADDANAVTEEQAALILSEVRKRQTAVGYSGNFRDWVERALSKREKAG